MAIGKVKRKKYQFSSESEWMELIPINEISKDKKDQIISTPKTEFCFYLNEQYIGIDLLQDNNKKEFKDFQYIYQLNKYQGVLLNVNSLLSHYKIIYYIFR